SLAKRRVVPLPRWRAHPTLSPDALFPLNALVWALYPQTTCFYKGVVNRTPRDPRDPYLVAFEGATFFVGFSPPIAVPQRYVFVLN
uniref:SGF29 C-terminal domain-containing protein n=1 Tax=Romanomermis culicivorax TaxID=13658 RepID=A0A915L4W3_ROMCU